LRDYSQGIFKKKQNDGELIKLFRKTVGVLSKFEQANFHERDL
jgi:hypothetical protein